MNANISSKKRLTKTYVRIIMRTNIPNIHSKEGFSNEKNEIKWLHINVSTILWTYDCFIHDAGR